ncbi:MAG TPA: hypothetical protein PLF84_22990 [Bryobacteraceae bacterium]|nr:hypothetical protein [Bryobacterales bacterium]HRJ21927.1 hypothetical protein [Bryobacteraceae bacterium]
MTPTISVLIPALLGHESVAAAIDAWSRQTRRDLIEILVLCPEAPTGDPPIDWRDTPIVVATGSRPLNQARAAAIRAASAPLVILAEDHCLPEPDFIENLLPALESGATALGPALRPGNSDTLAALTSFLLGYSQWMAPIDSGPIDILPGHNIIASRAELCSWGPELEDELLVASFLVQRLRREGGRFLIESRCRMRHFDPSSWSRNLRIFFCVGLGFGARRNRDAGWPIRLGYPLLAPAIAAAHWLRAFRQYRRTGAGCGVPAAALLNAIPFALAWAGGESLGAWAGIGRVAPLLHVSEIKPVSREMAARYFPG